MDALERDGGTVSVLGADNQSKEFLDLKEDIGVVLDETFVPEILTARQLGRIMAGTFRSWDQAAYEKWIARLELPEGIGANALPGVLTRLVSPAQLEELAKELRQEIF